MREWVKQRLTMIICIICVLCVLGMCGRFVFADNAETDITLANAPEGKFEYWTFSDLGSLNKTSDEELAKYGPIADTLDKTVFNGIINFSEKNFGSYYLGGNRAETGFVFEPADGAGLWLRVRTDGTVKDICELRKGIAKTTLRGNSELQVSLSVEYIDEYVKAEKTYITAKVGVFFDGVLYNNQYFTVSDLLKSDLRPGVNFKTISGVNYTIKSQHLYERTYGDDSVQYTYVDLLPMVDVETGTVNGHLPVDTMDKVMFSAKVSFGNMSQLHYGNTDANGWGGITFYQEGNNKTVLKMGKIDGDLLKNLPRDKYYFQVRKALGANATTFVDVEFVLGVYTEFVDIDGDGKDDLKLGVFFNGKLYDNKFIYIQDAGTDQEIGKRVNSNETPMKWMDYYEGMEDTTILTPPTDFTNITLLDAGVADGEDAAFLGGFEKETLDRTLFSMRIKYAVNMSRFHYGCTNSGGDWNYGGISFRMDSGKIIVGNEALDHLDGKGILPNLPSRLVIMNAETAGIGSTFENEEFLLQISTEFIDLDKDGEEDDIKLGIYVNGLLYDGRYFYIRNDAGRLGTGCNFNEGNAALFASHNYEGPYRGDYTELQASDFGFDSNKVYEEAFAGTYDQNSLDKTAINMMLTLPKEKGNKLYIGGEGQGICLTTTNNEKLRLSIVNASGQEQVLDTLEPDKAGLSKFSETQIKWRFTFSFTKIEGGYGTLSLGVAVNGTLYNGEDYVIKQAEMESLKRIVALEAVKGRFGLADYMYEELTFHDFSVLDTKVEKITDGSSVIISNYCDWNSLDGTAVSGTYQFSKDQGDRFGFGGTFWEGIIFASAGGRQISVSYVDSEDVVHNIVRLKPEKAGMSALLGEKVSFRITFDVIKTSETDADLRLGIYLGDKLYDGKHFMLRNVKQTTLTRTCKLYVYNGPYEIESVKTPSDLSIFGFDNKTWKDLFKVEQ